LQKISTKTQLKMPKQLNFYWTTPAAPVDNRITESI